MVERIRFSAFGDQTHPLLSDSGQTELLAVLFVARSTTISTVVQVSRVEWHMQECRTALA
jgi:hypothetical protein